MSDSVIWLIVGALLVALEVFAVPGIGFLFAGLAAVTTGIVIHLELAGTLIVQLGWFFGFTIAWAAALWKPMKKFRKSGKAHNYSNIVGDMATVINKPLKKGFEGEVKWSGSVMSAKLAVDSNLEEVAVGTQVKITDVSGNTLTVKPE